MKGAHDPEVDILRALGLARELDKGKEEATCEDNPCSAYKPYTSLAPMSKSYSTALRCLPSPVRTVYHWHSRSRDFYFLTYHNAHPLPRYAQGP